ncbi:hypothetical protein [Streptomyces aidingensis]|uniref:Uncharacterized protein n=1 Tax=Streptomyces aidingensis TaxID=910347 RepID=A0A1I1PSZ3_9ACTN|nr:hypothetical protein [Streptomyces aidingensis]SFD12959.1 hypothetical protein SAMN05421773_11033 [Streptomyces aidingensis]
MSADRARRRVITCACCGQTAAHRGRGYCVACYTRWVYHGRPASGPPAPGATPPKPRAAADLFIPARCRHGHVLGSANLRFTPAGVRYCRACRGDAERAYRERQFTDRHEGHDVIPTRDGRRYCRTCNRGDHDVDEIAVERAAGGDARGIRLTPAEREAAVLRLRAYGHPYWLIAERVGCALHTAWAICHRNGLTVSRRRRAAR